MKKLTALLLTLVLALSLTACGSNESKQLVGTWQCTVDITSQMDTEIGGALDAEYASETPMQMFLTAVFNDDGTFTPIESSAKKDSSFPLKDKGEDRT